jgi:hypothetical protein
LSTSTSKAPSASTSTDRVVVVGLDLEGVVVLLCVVDLESVVNVVGLVRVVDLESGGGLV